MENYTSIAKIKADDTVLIEGYVHDIRDFGGLKFVMLRDNTGMIQATVKKDAAQEIVDTVKSLTAESVVRVKGTAYASEKAKSGVEVLPESIEVLDLAEPNLPIPVTDKGVNTGQATRLDWRPLDLRQQRLQAIFRVQSALLEGIQKYLLSQDFQQVFTPCLLGIPSEGGSEVFPVLYFDKEAFLRQDPQLHRQLTIAGGMRGVFDIGPAWRAEESRTVRHLCEHRVCAVEAAFIKDEFDTMRIEEQVIISALTTVKEKCSADLEFLGAEITIPTAPFPEFAMPDVIAKLKELGKECPPEVDLDREAERIFADWVKKEHGVDFFFIHQFPFAHKPFYVKRCEDKEYARSVDLYFGNLELSSGGQRENNHEALMENVKEKGVTNISWFTDHFKYGVPPHGGFAIGIERLTMCLLGVENIRDCVLFPRDPDRVTP